ncbi:MAG: hypothetical protein JWL84_1566 [Rhodospirillales bacterium]|jgi:hypothetical protein|nr:hypothetical protein [Rhodospirillales bacterium]
MPPIALRCLIVLLTLTLISGNAHAWLHMGAEAAEQNCQDEQNEAGGEAPYDHHRHDADLGCCCDCLGCISVVNSVPAFSSTPAVVAVSIRYDDQIESLSGRVLLPEPDPPRTSV